jgi:hypothetical protein
VWGEFRCAASPRPLPIVHASGFQSAPIGGGDTRGEFRAQASTVSASVNSSGDGGGQFAGGDDNELGNLLAVIADDVQRMAAGMCQAIAAEYAGKIAYAHRSLPRDQVAGAVSALKAARQAALAVARQAAAAELVGRREAAVRARKPVRLQGSKLPDGPNRK